MKKLRKILSLLLLGLLSIVANAQATGQGVRVEEVLQVYNPAPRGNPVLLKLNEWYLLQSYPFAPYRDGKGTVMVPLRVVGELLGGHVYLSHIEQSGTIIGENAANNTSHKLEFKAGSAVVQVDERRVRVASAPYWLGEHEELFVPLEPLLSPFGIRVVGEHDQYVLQLDGPGILRDFYNPEWLPETYRDTDRLLPRNATVRRVLANVFGDDAPTESLEVALNLHRSGGPPIQQGQQGLFTYVLFQQGASSVGGPGTSTSLSGPAPEDPCVKTSAGFRCRQFFDASSPPDYIIARVRLRE